MNVIQDARTALWDEQNINGEWIDSKIVFDL